jgi:hypothetical protein
LATSPLKTLRFRLVFAICFWLWACMHAFVLHWFGFSWKMAIWDSAVSNLLLVGICLLITVSLQFYIPQKNKYGYILGLCIALAVLWLFISRGVLIFLADNFTDYGNFFHSQFPFVWLLLSLLLGVWLW